MSDDNTGIHPAPTIFTPEQIATDPILHFFHYAHLPAKLATISAPFCGMAHLVVTILPRNTERCVTLRKLLEAKDAAVRASVGPSPMASDHKTTATHLPDAGEPVEVGDHDIDRSGPIPFRRNLNRPSAFQG